MSMPKEAFSDMVNKKLVSFRIDPYINEAISQILVDVLVIAYAGIVMALARFPVSICIFVITLYAVVALLLHYRVAIQATIDKHREEYITEIVKFDTIVDEFSFMGDRLGRSRIQSFYPKEMSVSKCKIKVIDDQGKKKKIRSVMSFRRILNFSMLSQQKVESLQVTYLKRSKILIYVDLVEAFDKKTGHKTIRKIENSVHFINVSI